MKLCETEAEPINIILTLNTSSSPVVKQNTSRFPNMFTVYFLSRSINLVNSNKFSRNVVPIPVTKVIHTTTD